MKSTFLKFVIGLFLLVFTTGCSVDTDTNNDLQDSLNLTLEASSQRIKPGCGNTGVIIDPDYNFYSFYVEYEAGLPYRERQAIVELYCSKLMFRTQCTLNPNAELWVVRGNCKYPFKCKPDVVKPTHPDLRTVNFSEFCVEI